MTNTRVLFSIIFIFLSQIAHADEGFSPLVSSSCPTLQESDLNIVTLKSLIRNPGCGIRTISDVLAKLPNTYLGNYSLFYLSRSLQGPHQLDYENPRALVFGQFGNTSYPYKDLPHLIMGFNGDPSQAQHNSLEVVEINTKSDEVFRYYDIQFPHDEKSVGSLSWDDVQKRISISHANPRQCAACHGNPARPIFPGYPDWLGAFASLHVGIPAPEVVGFKKYLDKYQSSVPSRYKYLGDPLANLGDPTPEQALFMIDGQNSSINGDLGHANAQRVARLILRTPDYDKFRYAIVGAVLECDDFSTFLPSALKSDLFTNMETRFGLSQKWTYQKIDQLENDIYVNPRLFLLSQYVDGNTPNKKSFPVFKQAIEATASGSSDFLRLEMDTVSIQGIPRGDFMNAGLRLIMEGRGLDIGSWYMDLTQPTYRYHDGAYASPSTAMDVVQGDKGFDKNLAQSILAAVASPGGISDQARQVLCPQLKSESLQSLAQMRAGPLPPSTHHPAKPGTYPATFLNTCAKCHDAGMAAFPAIPFGHPHKMRQWLSSGSGPDWLGAKISGDETTHMPPIRFLTEVEKGDILSFLAQF